MKVFYSDQFVLPLPEGRRFPMVKYSMLRVPEAVSDEEILRAHHPDYLKRVVSGTLTDKEVRAYSGWRRRQRVERGPQACGIVVTYLASGNKKWYI